MGAGAAPENHDADGQRQHRHQQLADQNAKRARFSGLVERPPQIRDCLIGDAIDGFARQLVDVGRGERQHGPRSDVDQCPAVERSRLDRPGHVRRSQLVEHALGRSDSFGGSAPQDARPEHDNRTVEKRESRRLAGHFGGDA